MGVGRGELRRRSCTVHRMLVLQRRRFRRMLLTRVSILRVPQPDSSTVTTWMAAYGQGLQSRMKLSRSVAASCLIAVLLLVGCEAVSISTPPPTVITIAGATAMRPVLRELTAAFSARRPDTLFDLRGGGSTLGLEQVRSGAVTLGASTLLPPEDGEPSDGLLRYPIGLDGIAAVVHPNNEMTSLSLVQLRDIYAGDVLNWMQLGGRDGEILLVSREEGSGTRTNFERRVMVDTPVSLTAVVMPTGEDVVDYVSRHPEAIGYVSMAYLPATDAQDPPVHVVAVEGVLPTLADVTAQRYPIIQPLYLVSREAPGGRVREFIDFVLSPTGQAIVKKLHGPIR